MSNESGMEETYGLAIIGGGINGCGIARDAAGRGLSVYLCEANDLASGTSSRSTKLVHGGLRYLEYYQFRLVREALAEREVLWRNAPHIVSPMRFVLPHLAGLRPAWLLRLGLFMYDHLGGRKLLPPTAMVDLTHGEVAEPLKPGLCTKGFEYSDCRVDDARLVILNAQDAARRGAVIETRTTAISARRNKDGWRLTVETRPGAIRRSIRARVLVNAAGPWVADVLSNCLHVKPKAKLRLVQGSHIVVRKLFDHGRSYIFQNSDGRVVFAIPFEHDFTLIGTTDRDYDGDLASVHASKEEAAYLCAAASAYFARPVWPGDIIWTFSGVRPLYDDGANDAKAATRDYVIDIDESEPGAPLFSIFGGKLTTYRRLAEAALARLSGFLPAMGPPWTAKAVLPGGDFAVDGLERLASELHSAHPFLSPRHATRLTSAYGTQAYRILAGARCAEDLGVDFGVTLTEAEVRWLMDEEWAREASDVLWRRSKLGLFMSREQALALDTFMSRVGETTESSKRAAL